MVRAATIDVGAVLRESQGHGASDAARGAGDEGELVFERFLVLHDMHSLAQKCLARSDS